MRKKLGITALLALAAASVPVVGGGPDPATSGRAGEAAPPFSWEKVVQAPADAKTDLDSLRGQVVVIDFWSIACGPCVRAIPVWNKLVDRYAAKSVTFIAVTEDDDLKALYRFLAKHPIRGLVASDSDRSMFKAYGVNALPSTVVINAKGAIVGWTSVYDLIDEPGLMRRIIRGDPVSLAKVAWSERPDLFADAVGAIDGAGSAAPEPLCLILIRPASGTHSLIGGTDRERRADGVTLRDAIKEFYPIRGGALQFDFEPPDDEYDVYFRWPKGDIERGRALLRDAIEATFDITVTVEKRLTDVYVMTADKERAQSWEPGRNQLHIDPETGNAAPTKALLARMNAGESLFFTMGTVEELSDAFSFALEFPVVDETGVEGHYIFCFPWSKEDSTVAQTIALAKKHLGVTLTRDRRRIDVHVVRRRSSSGHAPPHPAGN